MTTVDYRSSEEVIFVLKEAMKDMEGLDQSGSDGDPDQDVAMKEETEDSQADETPTEERGGDGEESPEQPPPPPPPPPAKKLPPTQTQFFKSVLMLKGKFFHEIPTPNSQYSRSGWCSETGKQRGRQMGNVGR